MSQSEETGTMERKTLCFPLKLQSQSLISPRRDSCTSAHTFLPHSCCASHIHNTPHTHTPITHCCCHESPPCDGVSLAVPTLASLLASRVSQINTESFFDAETQSHDSRRSHSSSSSLPHQLLLDSSTSQLTIYQSAAVSDAEACSRTCRPHFTLIRLFWCCHVQLDPVRVFGSFRFSQCVPFLSSVYLLYTQTHQIGPVWSSLVCFDEFSLPDTSSFWFGPVCPGTV